VSGSGVLSAIKFKNTVAATLKNEISLDLLCHRKRQRNHPLLDAPSIPAARLFPLPHSVLRLNWYFFPGKIRLNVVSILIPLKFRDTM
jgi:hypothetical protein